MAGVITTNPKIQFSNAAGIPLVGGSVTVYLAGTTTPTDTWFSKTLTNDNKNTNPIVLDSRGECVIWLDPLLVYKFVLADAQGNVQWTQDNIAGAEQAGLEAPTGSSRIGFIQSGTDALAQTVQSKLRTIAAFTDFEGVDPTGIADSSAGMQKALNAHKTIMQLSGTFRLEDELTLQDGQCIILGAGVTIRQYTAEKNIFKAIQKNNVWIHCNGAVLYGQGGWSAAWTGNNHHDRAVNFLGCTRSGVTNPVIKNCALAGIAIFGGSDILIAGASIEGTNTYSTPIPLGGNFQHGIYIRHDPTYGAADGVRVVAPDISGTAQGILIELEVGATQPVQGITISAPVIHNITGQHGCYITAGRVAISGPVFSSIALAAVKIQGGDANQDIIGVNVSGLVARAIGSQVFEVAVPTPWTGAIKDVSLEGVCFGAFRGISITRQIQRLRAKLTVDSTEDVGILIQGPDVNDIDLDFIGYNIGTDGIQIVATNSAGIRIRPKITNPNLSNTSGQVGIRVASPTVDVTLFDPFVVDNNTRMRYGLYNEVDGASIKVIGSATFTGAADTAVRASEFIESWPTDATLQGVNGEFLGLQNVRGPNSILSTITTSSAVNTVLAYQAIPDECSALVTVEISAKTADSGEQRSLVICALFSRNGGVCAKIGATTVISDIASGGFAGAYSLQSDGGNNAVVVVNSGGAADYNWKARTTVTRIS